MPSNDNDSNDSPKLPFQLHPRVFAALGSDLVTNDLVAITELVKNSYDAFATRVDVRFCHDDEYGAYIEIEDDGHGMDFETIENVWCVVATPFRHEQPVAKKGRRSRRVSGEKGLGRLSVARLGDFLEMTTLTDRDECWQVSVDWSALAQAENLDGCFASVEKCEESPLETTGTLLRIYDLKSNWDDDRIDELEEYLSRLISPFAAVDDFEIWLTRPGAEAACAEIAPPAFLEHPKYRIEGQVDAQGNVECNYAFQPIGSKRVQRRATEKFTWDTIKTRNTPYLSKAQQRQIENMKTARCGPFSFEIRAWDIGADDRDEIAEAYEVKKGIVRSAIKAHKGVSVYRDGILVLPKSEGARDWLGLDIRRVSKVGERMSTSQLVGYAAITAQKNPEIKDTSDRERLVDVPETTAFEHILRNIVSVLENERLRDRLEKETAAKPMTDLFEGLSGDQLVSDVSEAAEQGAPTSEIIPVAKNFGRKLDKTRKEIERRFVYYNRLATIGTIAQLLVHEVRTRTTIIDLFRQAVADFAEEFDVPNQLLTKMRNAELAIRALEQLAETFAPMASRTFRRGRRHCVLQEQIKRCIEFRSVDLKTNKIEVASLPSGVTNVAVDPGELDAVLLNLLDNAIYWVGQSTTPRQIAFSTSRIDSGKRVRVAINDSGPGIEDDDAERVFWPGVTRKPDGIGMGLTVASEIVVAYDGQMGLGFNGKLGGATFVFDLPVKQ